MEADLLGMGFTMADVPHRVTWGTLIAYCAHAPRHSALYKVANGDAAQWGHTDHLIADVIDQIRHIAWMWSADGAKGRRHPPPIRRPGQIDLSENRWGTAHMTIEQANHWLGWE